MIPLFLAIGSTVVACVGYVYFMVKKPKTKSKRKPQSPEPIREEPKLKLEDYAIA